MSYVSGDRELNGFRPFAFYEIESSSMYKLFDDGVLDESTARYEIILFVHGHLASGTFIAEFNNYIHKQLARFSLESSERLYYRFFAVDFADSPSAFQDGLIESQSNFLNLALKYLRNNIPDFGSTFVHLIGHSMGGLVIAKCMTDHREALKTY